MMMIATLLAATVFAFAPGTTVSSSGPPTQDPGQEAKTDNDATSRPELPRTDIGDRFRVGSSGDTIGAEVDVPGRGGVRGPVSISSTGGPRCVHGPASYGDFPNVVPPDATDIPDPGSQINRDDNGRAERGWYRDCGSAAPDFYWAPVTVDPVDLVPDALARAAAQLPVPTPAINPDATAGGIVNLGMWLAIDDPGTTTTRATLANVWAQVTASVSRIEVDLGNGDTVTCDGLGTQIPDTALDLLDQGPCGYTYRRSSPDDDPYRLSISAVHDIVWTTSDGRTGVLASLRRTITIDYDVDEIQTIGVSN